MFPTLRKIFGISSERKEKGKITGSFYSLLKGKSPRAGVPPPSAYAEHNSYGEPQRALRVGHWKLIERMASHRLELYDLDKDPGETHNLAWDNPHVVRKLKNQMDKIAEENQTSKQSPSMEMSPDQEEKMRRRLKALGYIQ